jgi:hypothetical protein
MHCAFVWVMSCSFPDPFPPWWGQHDTELSGALNPSCGSTKVLQQREFWARWDGVSGRYVLWEVRSGGFEARCHDQLRPLQQLKTAARQPLAVRWQPGLHKDSIYCWLYGISRIEILEFKHSLWKCTESLVLWTDPINVQISIVVCLIIQRLKAQLCAWNGLIFAVSYIERTRRDCPN